MAPLAAAELTKFASAGAMPTTVPATMDEVPQPGIEGRRGVGFFRIGGILLLGVSRLHFGACSFFCRVFIDGIERRSHRASGYTPFWVELGSFTDSNAAHEIIVLADNRFNRTTAPLHTGGDFYEFGGLTRTVTLHQTRSTAAVIAENPVVIPTADLKHVNLSVSLLRAAAADLPVVVSFSTPTLYGETVVLGSGCKLSTNLTLTLHAGGSAFQAAMLPLCTGGGTPLIWSASSPTLYTVTVQLGGDSVTARFGMRSLGVSAGGRLTVGRAV